ncbi:Cell differentiation rcd1 [Olea europaea subsp. europaea]|nr:Cell differentiation rcd1 [Olea europaea subsp. europaea]
MREKFQDFGLLLWQSFGTMAILLQEVIGIYPYLSPPTLTSAQSNRACNALALLQCVASHPCTRRSFVKAHFPLYLYSFLTTNCKLRPFEYLRLTCLGVLGALVKGDDTAVIRFLLDTEIMPLCLRLMENGNEMSKTVAAYILLKILQDGEGLGYVCVAADRFYAVCRVLRSLVVGLAEKPSPLLLKHIIKCYIRMSEDPRGRIALRDSLPEILMDGTFNSLLNVSGSQCTRRSNDEKVSETVASQCSWVSGLSSRYCLQYIDDDAFHTRIEAIAKRRVIACSSNVLAYTKDPFLPMKAGNTCPELWEPASGVCWDLITFLIFLYGGWGFCFLESSNPSVGYLGRGLAEYLVGFSNTGDSLIYKVQRDLLCFLPCVVQCFKKFLGYSMTGSLSVVPVSCSLTRTWMSCTWMIMNGHISFSELAGLHHHARE